jgi:hypothetical protein
MRLDEYLVEVARELLKRRFPGDEGIAAAMYTDDGTVLTSVFLEPEWGSVALCSLDTSPKSVILVATIAVCSGIDPSLCRGLDDTSPYVLT